MKNVIHKFRKEDPKGAYWFLNKGSWVSEKHKFCYIQVPKVACTKLALTIQILEGYEIPHPLSLIHLRNPEHGPFVRNLASFSHSEQEKILNSKDWFRFCFVRNPYSRLLSAYKNKIFKEKDPFFATTISDLKSKLGYPQDGTLSFRDFATFVCSQQIGQREWHWKNQSSIVRPDLISYGYIGRFEQFEKDFVNIFSQFSPKNWNEEATTKYVVSFPSPLPIAYDIATAKMVYEAFKNDFETFGYEKNSWMYKA